jgi:hypothetical protein
MDTKAVKPPSAARCNRVQQVLVREPAFRELLGPKTVEFKRRDDITEMYPSSVVEIVTRLQNDGFDANNCTRDEILDAAKNFFAASPEVAEKAPPSVTLSSEVDRSALADAACLGVYGLLMSAKVVGEHDRKPGAASRLQMIQRAIEVYRPLVAVAHHVGNGVS